MLPCIVCRHTSVSTSLFSVVFLLSRSVNKFHLNGFHLFCKETAQVDGMFEHTLFSPGMNCRVRGDMQNY